MKELKKYLNPKSQWHPLEFPVEFDPHAIIKFLDNHKFTRLQDPDYTLYTDYAEFYTKKRNIKTPTYMYDGTKYDEHIYFFNGGKMSVDNPLVILTRNDGYKFYHGKNSSCCIDYISSDYEAAYKKIVKLFEW